MQPVGDHQFLLAFFFGNSHRLLTQYMDAGARGADRVFAMQMVGQPDVDGNDVAAFQPLLVFLVAGEQLG